MEIVSGKSVTEIPVNPNYDGEAVLMPRVTMIPNGIAKVLRDSEPIIPEPTHEELAQDQAETLLSDAEDLLQQTGVRTKIKDGGNATATRYSHEVVTEDGEKYYAFLAEYDKWKLTIPPTRNPLTGIRVIHSRTNDPRNLDVSLEDGGLNFNEDADGNVGLYSLDSTVGQPVVNSAEHLAYMHAIITDIQEQHAQAQDRQTVKVAVKDKEENQSEFTKKQKIIAVAAGAVALTTTMLGIAKQFTEPQEQPRSPQYDTSFIQPKQPNIHFGEPNYPTNPPEEYVTPKDGNHIPLPDAPPASISTPPEPPFSKGEDNYSSQDPDSSPEWDWNTPNHSNGSRPIFQPQIFPDSISPQ